MKQNSTQKDSRPTTGLKLSTKSFAAELREDVDYDESVMETLQTLYIMKEGLNLQNMSCLFSKLVILSHLSDMMKYWILRGARLSKG